MIRFLLIFIGFSFFNTLLMAQEEVGYYIKLKPEGKQIVQDIVCKGDSILIQNEYIKTKIHKDEYWFKKIRFVRGGNDRAYYSTTSSFHEIIPSAIPLEKNTFTWNQNSILTSRFSYGFGNNFSMSIFVSPILYIAGETSVFMLNPKISFAGENKNFLSFGVFYANIIEENELGKMPLGLAYGMYTKKMEHSVFSFGFGTFALGSNPEGVVFLAFNRTSFTGKSSYILESVISPIGALINVEVRRNFKKSSLALGLGVVGADFFAFPIPSISYNTNIFNKVTGNNLCYKLHSSYGK